TCCLLESGVRCVRPAGNACYNKRIQKTVQQKRLKFVVDPGVSQMYICEHHKNMIQNYRNQQHQKSRDNNNHNDNNNSHNNRDINFLMLPLSLLRRYKRNFKLISKPGCNKAQLADIVARHFSKIQVDQKDVLTCFLYTCKSNRSQ
ncbi:hypothetical protein HELRODRAFT_143740, partial [Helobdella robusta]|uniref:Histone deacetylase complex subunit SAP30 Sin3 binding domain-containing protein n=1 Tax=Helobdella robusta TaxID=6412 RepID=T1EJC0_HELRO